MTKICLKIVPLYCERFDLLLLSGDGLSVCVILEARSTISGAVPVNISGTSSAVLHIFSSLDSLRFSLNKLTFFISSSEIRFRNDSVDITGTDLLKSW